MVTAVQISPVFPPKDLEKIRTLKYASADFFFHNFSESFQLVTSVEKSRIFPPKNLEKIRAPKIRMRGIFLKFNSF